MNRKFKVDQYEVCVNFKSDNFLSITVEYMLTGEFYQNDNVELIRIKKDTVFATLEKKSQKNLICQLQQFVEEGQKFLIASFIVNFDYLPEFREQIRLEYVQTHDSLKSLKVNNFQIEIEQIERALQNLQKNGFTVYSEIGTVNLTGGKKSLWKSNLEKGKYLLRLSTIFTNSSGNVSSDKVTFETILPNKQALKTETFAYNMSGYSYPLSFSQIIEVDEGECEIIIMQSNLINCSVMNTHVVLNPILQIN